MSSWSEGYVTEVGYTFGYYRELNPLRMRLAFIEAGLAVPYIKNACELGFGQGVSVNIHAAAGDAAWYGTDFNPAQAGFARELAQSAGSGAALFDDSFAEFAKRDDLPQFDFIGMHGTWSWIDDENRAVLVDFIRRRLAIGGVLYVSYNTLPGWAPMIPVRELLLAHSEALGARGQGIVSRVEGAFSFLEQLLSVNPNFSRVVPGLGKAIGDTKPLSRQYLAHEYFNRSWSPMAFNRMAEWLSSAKLDYACSAYFPDFVDPINLTQPQQQLLAEIADPGFRQLVRDFIVNQQFRRDYWIRGARPLSPMERVEALRAHRVMLIQPRADVPLKYAGGVLGEVDLQEAIYGPLLDLLADHRARSIGEIERAMSGRCALAHIVQAVFLLEAAERICSVQDDAAIARATAGTRALNEALCRKARDGESTLILASPVSGGGIAVGRVEAVLLQACWAGGKTVEDWVGFALHRVLDGGLGLVKEGRILEGEEENRAALREHAKILSEKKLPIYRALGLI